eukprot:CAMPEP_0171063740 /NCGR_PEP_ID=MMETSP0766_2-20121228/5857_1 /TAXON_ID=439317 /ORGANISM="Gambierdiscus australes, Strain CAWD 149" /LENGTH=114 /DNA_ID=CAMNT_0011519689 /DNA_START=50 /DNA_END=394 /DNA_ORIENTATION=+
MPALGKWPKYRRSPSGLRSCGDSIGEMLFNQAMDEAAEYIMSLLWADFPEPELQIGGGDLATASTPRECTPELAKQPLEPHLDPGCHESVGQTPLLRGSAPPQEEDVPLPRWAA